jgi:hypothetical protein
MFGKIIFRTYVISAEDNFDKKFFDQMNLRNSEENKLIIGSGKRHFDEMNEKGERKKLKSVRLNKIL